MSIAFKKLRPLLNRVVVSKPEATKVSKGGIILKSSESVSWGTVVSVGPGRTLDNGTVRPISVAVGDHVLLPEYGGAAIKLDGEELFVYRDDDIVGILEEPLKQ